MRSIFVDTFYWVALANAQDSWNQQAKSLYSSLLQTNLVTTDEVLVEFVNYFSTTGEYARSGVLQQARQILQTQQIEVVPQTHQSLLDGLALYEKRLDKGYSLTDCISMYTMRARGITEVLTHDHHFTQEGFVLLLTD
jgi:uncharacterized protein